LTERLEDRQIAQLGDAGAGCLDFDDGFIGVHAWVEVTAAVETLLTECLAGTVRRLGSLEVEVHGVDVVR